MNLEEQLKKPLLNREASFYVASKQLNANISYIKEKKIQNLTLIPNQEGYGLNNIDFLQELPFIKRLQMGACTEMKSFEGLNYLKDLDQLTFNAPKDIKVNLSGLKSLEELNFSYTNNILGLSELHNIKTLSVSSGTNDFFKIEIFRNYKNLKNLKIFLSTITNGVCFLQENNNLESLEFSHMKRAFDIEGIQHLKNTLRRLNFSSSKKIDNINLISELINLEALGFIESVKLQNAEILKPLKKLEALGIYGSSSFIDGDLRSLNQMSKTIKHYKVQNKKHYFYM